MDAAKHRFVFSKMSGGSPPCKGLRHPLRSYEGTCDETRDAQIPTLDRLDHRLANARRRPAEMPPLMQDSVINVKESVRWIRYNSLSLPM